MMLVPGLGLMAIPDVLLDLFGLSYGEELWTARMLGLLAFIIGVYYFYMTKHGSAQLYTVTIAMRYFAVLFMIGLWISGAVEIMILLFAAVDGIAATWTLLALRKSDS